MGERIRLHNMVLHTRVLGPGTRAAIWTQGCERRCPGCMSPSSRPLDGGDWVDVDLIMKELSGLGDLEGVTISGGEPFLQIRPLHSLLCALRRETKLGIILYTGYTMEELRSMDQPQVADIITGLADLIIDGPYLDQLNDGTALKGSGNQGVNFITDRYLPFQALYQQKKREIEIIAAKGEMFLIGVPAKDTLEEWQRIFPPF